MTTGPSDPAWPPQPAPDWPIVGDTAPPPPPPPLPVSLRTSGWVLPAPGQPSRWPGTGTVVRRTATVLVSAPRTFLALAVLGAIPGFVGLLLPQPAPSVGGIDAGLLIMTIALALLGGIWALVIGTVTIVATAEVAAHRQPRLAALFSDLDRPVIAAVAAAIVLLLAAVVAGALLVGAIAALSALRLAGIGVILVLAGMVVVLIAILRCSLVLPAIILETRGPIDAIRRSWDVTHRLTWHLLGYTVGVGLLVGLPISAAQLTTLLSSSPVVRLAAIVVTAPVTLMLTIGSTVLFGHLIGRPWNLRDRVPRAVALSVSVAVLSAIAIGGFASMAVAQSPLFTYMTDRSAGQVQFGRSVAPATSCHVGTPASSFGPDDAVYVSAVFLLPVGNGIPVTRELSRNGVIVSAHPISIRGLTSCYVEQSPLDHLADGTYRLTFREQQYVLADGQFVVQGGTSTQTSRAPGFRKA